MTDPWADEGQLPLEARVCPCFGRFGCAHVGEVGPARLSADAPDFDSRLLEIGGFDLSTVRARPQRSLVLPHVMPVIDGSAESFGVYRPVVIVPVDAVRTEFGSRTFRSQLSIPSGVQLIVSMYADDRTLESIWNDRPSVVSRLVALRPAAVLAPSYSAWSGDPWTEQRYALKRSLEFYRILQDNALPAIPHLVWGRSIDAADLVEWLTNNRPDTIATDAQCVGPLFEAWVRQLAWIYERLARPPLLVVSGIQPGYRLHRTIAAWPESRFVYNGLRLAASHRELRLRTDGRLRRVRHAAHASIQLSLPLGLRDPDPAGSVLYQRSLRVFERAVIAAGERVAAPEVRGDGGLGHPRARHTRVTDMPREPVVGK